MLLDHQSEVLKKSKSRNISKGLLFGFDEKCEFSSVHGFVSKIGKVNVPCNLLYRKLVFLDYENTNLKKWTNLHFSKGVGPWFWSKISSFYDFKKNGP